MNRGLKAIVVVLGVMLGCYLIFVIIPSILGKCASDCTERPYYIPEEYKECLSDCISFYKECVFDQVNLALMCVTYEKSETVAENCIKVCNIGELI